ncbi:ubiquinone biosynthesis methyltransferase UbiE [Candidatus Nitromaritima sp. SCGC AAA799-A02]|nr:ubiquinone biosynthesis methyltransferase UbiE [Candidatus Nitromaritima sp. SCGC AAA799-C22]KMP12742.1 ubiquinone biosynthesis methyltransferase UbiE [Candidatus Nitromaritima sp. SCGC AAA799-A02]
MNEMRPCCDDETVEDVSRNDVRDFYSKAAVNAQESLCCPTQYDLNDLSHIPKEVTEISYGCGSPVGRAGLSEGEVMVDLGSGGGIDCFIAAKHVGKTGRVYGIDMTEEMLGVARKNAERVAENLGYNNIEFKQGFLESIPLDDTSVDLVTSNCVINLSTDKDEVFKEIHRILKPGGRFLIADVISEKDVPEEMKNNKELWGECVSGALTLNDFLDHAGNNRFKGLRVQKDYLWKEVEDIKFYSYTIEGFKHVPDENTSCCKSLWATYAGPFESVTFQGTVFPISVPVEVDEDTAQLMSSHSYTGQFIITDPETEKPAESESSCCG